MSIIKTARFKFTRLGKNPVIEIYFGNGEIFYLYKEGADLTDFDRVLEFFIPNLDLEKINHRSARFLEERLYRLLSDCRQQHIALKALSVFCNHVEDKYRQKYTRLNSVRNFMELLSQLAFSRKEEEQMCMVRFLLLFLSKMLPKNDLRSNIAH